MNREHKYRAWDIADDRLCKVDEIDFIDGSIYVRWYQDETHQGHYPLHRGEYILDEFTGKRDSKRTPEFPEGQEEYEGDKVRIISDYYDYISIIRWNEKTASLILDYPPGSEFDFAPVGWVQDIVEDGGGTLEVVGNAHQPEEEEKT